MSKKIKTITRGIFFTSLLFFHNLTNAYSIGGYSLTPLVDYSSIVGLNYSYAHDINNSGEVAGESLGYDYYDEHGLFSSLGYIPVKWNSAGDFQKLGFVKTEYSMFGVSGSAIAINDSGVVVGNSGNRSFIWSQAVGIKEIGFLNSSDTSSEAIALNNRNNVVGRINGADGTKYYFWNEQNGQSFLNTSNLPENTFVSVSAINNNDIVVGAISSSSDLKTYAAIGTQQGGMNKLFDLPNLVESSANAINDHGQVVGYYLLDSSQDYYTRNPFLWDPVMGLIDLNIPQEFEGSQISAVAINNSGSVLGVISDNQVQGFIWDAANGFRLLSSITDVISKPTEFGSFGVIVPLDINDIGQILISSPVDGKAYVLTPVLSVPEPENLGMLLAGLGAVLVAQRRREPNA